MAPQRALHTFRASLNMPPPNTMSRRPRGLRLAMVCVAAMLASLGSLVSALPAITEVTIKAPVLASFDFDTGFTLAWEASGGFPTAGASKILCH